MPDEIFLSEQHPISRRWAVFEDDGLSAWLYLTKPDSEKIVADCWIYNRVTYDPVDAPGYRAKAVAPPAPSELVVEGAIMSPPATSAFRFQWSHDGDSVALVLSESLMGFIASGQQRGYSRNLKGSGPWGHPLDEDLYRSVFKAS